jgi:hypothetical protein
MELTPYLRKLQLALQERCRKQVRALRDLSLEKECQQAVNSEGLLEVEHMQKAKQYIVFSYMLMKHFILNPSNSRDIYLDLNF